MARIWSLVCLISSLACFSVEGKAAGASAPNSSSRPSLTKEARQAYVGVVEDSLVGWDVAIHRIRANANDPIYRKKASPEQTVRMANELEIRRQNVNNLLTHLIRSSDTDWTSWRDRIEEQLASMNDRFSDMAAAE